MSYDSEKVVDGETLAKRAPRLGKRCQLANDRRSMALEQRLIVPDGDG
jgi:hypothetical protein